ncbi:hypothetical protein D3C71_1680580 [compost metagenome]
MARRRKSSTAEDLMDLVALLPWWAGVVLALVSYWVLHAIATRPLPVAQPSASPSSMTTGSILPATRSTLKPKRRGGRR